MSKKIVKKQTEEQQLPTRYSDADLEEFHLLISGKIDTARKELAFLQSQLTGKDAAGNEIERYLESEDGSATRELEQTAQLIARQIQFINNLENALLRIQNKTYGICRQTGKLIDKARLRAVPHATLSMEAKSRS